MTKTKRNRHVIVLNQFALPLSQGGGTRHAELFSRLEDWDYTIIAGNRNHYTQQGFKADDVSFRLVRVPPQKGGALARVAGWISYSAQAFVCTLRAPQVDAVYASSPHPLTPLVGWAAAKILRVPMVLEVRDLWPESIVSAGKLKPGSVLHRILASVERFSVKNADLVVGVTEGWESHFRDLGARKFRVVSNGAVYRTQVEAIGAEDYQKLRPEVSGPCGVFAGAHGPKDGIDAIIDAAKSYPTVGFTLIGSGVMKSNAQKRAIAEGLSNVKFLDPVPKATLGKVLSAFDFGIHSVSPLDVFSKGMSPNKLFDYMAHDLAIVSNAGQALDRIVRDGPIGPVTDDLGDAVSMFLAASNLEREVWRQNRRNLMTGRYSRLACARTLNSLLLDATRQHKRG